MDPRTARIKGAATEQAYVEYLRENGAIYAERRHLNGAADLGDVVGIPGLVVEIKSAARWCPVEWSGELAAEMRNANADMGFVAARPKGRPRPADWIALLPMPLMMKLLTDAGWLPEADQ